MAPLQQVPVLGAPPSLADIMHELQAMRMENQRHFAESRRRCDRIEDRQQAYEDALFSVYPHYQFPQWPQND